MNDAESKTKTKRIRHCYPRQEVYHRFIHDNEYYYSNQSNPISSKGNYLSLGDIGKNKSIEDIEQYWYPSNRVFAVIDREHKKILVSHKYKDITHELLNAIPDDYEVFHCKDDIPAYNILNSEHINTLAKLHLQYSIECYVERYLVQFYAILHDKTVLHTNIDSIIEDDGLSVDVYRCSKYYYNKYYAIKLFVKKYKVKQRPWYNQCLNDNFKLYIYHPNAWSNITIKLPTVKQVLTNTVFSKFQKETFRKKYFYTKYCYGRGIPYADVDKYYGTSITPDEAIRYFAKRNLYLNTELLTDIYNWNDLISKTKEIETKINANYIKQQIDKSEDNYRAAVEELRKLESEYTVNSWREGKRNGSPNSVTYRKFVKPVRSNDRGYWITAAVHSSSKTFANTQLKLEGNVIRTSKNATVTLDEGIKLYKMFIIGRNNKPNKTHWTTSDFGKVNVGIYNLRHIRYTDKVTDTGTLLGYKEWCIQIGCHSLWLDDIEDFIRYYHLEDFIRHSNLQDKFGINKEQKKCKN